jgi:hypothetical protein
MMSRLNGSVVIARDASQQGSEGIVVWHVEVQDPTRNKKVLIADEAMTQLNSLSGPDFDRAYGTYQLRLLTAVVAQYGAYSQDTNNSAPLRRYAQAEFPKMKDALENVTRLTAGK